MWVPNREWGLLSAHLACSDDSFGLILTPKTSMKKKKKSKQMYLNWNYSNQARVYEGL